MAPEFPPTVVVINLEKNEKGLAGSSQFVEGPTESRLRVRWVEEGEAEGFLPIGEGVAHVMDFEKLDISDPQPFEVPKTEDGSAYSLQESVPPGDPWRMLIILFPKGHIPTHLKPRPDGAKRHGERLALFWVLRGDDLGRNKITWQIRETAEDPLEEHRKGLSADVEETPSPSLNGPNLSVVASSRPAIFVCYSHEDEKEKDELILHLTALKLGSKNLDVWSDDQIPPGGNWKPEIERAINISRAAVLLVTKNFLASEFIQGTEIPLLLERRAGGEMHVFPLIAKHCAWKAVDWLSELQVRPKNGVPVWSEETGDPDKALGEIIQEISKLV